MKYLLLILLPLAMTITADAKGKSKKAPKLKSTYGAKISKKKPMNLEDVMANYKKYKGKKVVVSGLVKKVCEKSGCWMSLESGTAKVRTLFKDYGFFVPKELMGKGVKVEGKLVQKTLKASEVRHFMKDEGKSSAEISRVTKPQKVFQFIADGIVVLGS